MIAGTLVVPFGDAMSKLVSTAFNPLEVAMWRFFFQTVFLGLGMLVWRQSFKLTQVRLVFMGGLTAATTLASLIGAFAVMPIATAIAIFFVEPLILTLFSVWFLGERTGWRRLVGVVVGLAGALVIIRPSWTNFGWQAILPLIAAAAFAGNAVVMRKLTNRMSPLVTQFWFGLVACGLIGVALGAAHAIGLARFGIAVSPSGLKWLLPVMGLLSGLTFMLFTEAFQRAEASILAPLQYIEIIGATAVGYWFFGDFPDTLTFVGAAIILVSGLFVLQRSRPRGPVASQPGPNV